jgi:hypothetical protein
VYAQPQPMARKPVSRRLPPLNRVFSPLSGAPADTSKQLVLLRKLRKVATRLRCNQPVPFYSMRDIAEYFHLPLRTVALSYEALELEGILNRIRGSQTLLTGRVDSSRKPVRAVVGIPVWLHSLVVSPFSRALHLILEERLRKSGFVADLIFFHDEESYQPEFAERLIQHNLDQIIWNQPHPLASNILLSLQDHGVRQVTIQHTERPLDIGIPTYLMDWQPAYDKLAKNWHELGIRKVIVPEPVNILGKQAMKTMATALEKSGLEMEVIEGRARALRQRVFANRKVSLCGVAFLDQLGSDAICNEDPVIVEEIMNRVRIAFCRGPIRLPYFNRRLAKADVIRFSPAEIANRVAEELNTPKGCVKGIIHTFQAGFQPDMDLGNQKELL